MVPAKTPRVFHVETTWKRPFPRRFNVEYTWYVCRDASFSKEDWPENYKVSTNLSL